MIRITLLILITLFVMGCDERSKYSTELPTNTAQTNIERARLGIRQIGSEWVFIYRVNNEDIWKSDKNNDFGDKKVIYDEDYSNIIFEYDVYYTGKQYPRYVGPEYDGIDFENVTVSYDYKKGLFLVHYTGPDSVIKEKLNKLQLTSGGFYAPTNEETLKIADEILAMFGMSRL